MAYRLQFTISNQQFLNFTRIHWKISIRISTMNYTSKSAAAKIFLSSLLPLFSRLTLTVSGTPTTAADSPETVPGLTFLHDFIDRLELQSPASMVAAAAHHLASLYSDSTSILFYLESREKLMVITGAQPSSGISKEILKLRKKFSDLNAAGKALSGCAPKIPLQTIDETRISNKLSAELSETLSLAGATPPNAESGQFIFYSTSKPGPKERQLLNYCLQHLNKRVNEAHNWEKLEKANRLDSLTGLNNRRCFDDIMNKESERAERYHHPTSLIMLDLDHFKKVNDNFGHQTGDQVLRILGKILLEEVRQCDTPCRYGGEEFAIILPETELGKAIKIAERIRQTIEQENIVTHNNIHLKITASLGIASTEENQSIDLIEAADQALYHAKKSGRNRLATTPAAPKAVINPVINHCFPSQAVLV